MRNTLRQTKPLERDIQAGVLELLRLMPEVAWVHKQFVGSGVLVRPANGLSVRKELMDAGFSASRLAYIQGAPVGVLDTALQLTGISKHCELEVKQMGKHPSVEQLERMRLIRDNGGLADWVDDIDQVQPLIREWSGGI